MKTCVIIPTYNESNVIADLIRQLHQQNIDIVVIDDGSRDNTAAIAEAQGVVVIRNLYNLGKGASLIRGFNYILDKGFDAVITMDGDGQHRPEEIPNFLSRAESSASGIIIGNRMSDTKNMPALRFATNKFMSWLISKIAKQKIPDTQCGFRLIKKEVLEKLNLTTANYDTESEVLIRAARLGFKIDSLPVKTVYSNERSRINPFVDTLRFIRLIFRILWTT